MSGAVDGGDVEAGRGRQLTGPCRVHRGCPAALARPCHPGREGGVPGPIGRVGEQRLDRHARVVGAGLDRVDQRAGGKPAAAVGPQHRRHQLPPVRRSTLQQPAQGGGTGGVESTSQPGSFGPGPEPAADRLGAEVVVGGAVGLPGQVVAGRVGPRREHRHRHHHARFTHPPRTMAAKGRTGATGRGRDCSCSPVCREPCQPRGSPGRISTNRRTGRLADPDGHRGKGLRDGRSGHRSPARVECSACRCAVMSATVVAEVVQQVVQRYTGGCLIHVGAGRARLSSSSRDPRAGDPRHLWVIARHAHGDPWATRIDQPKYRRHRGQHRHGQHPRRGCPHPPARTNQSAAHRCIPGYRAVADVRMPVNCQRAAGARRGSCVGPERCSWLGLSRPTPARPFAARPPFPTASPRRSRWATRACSVGSHSQSASCLPSCARFRDIPPFGFYTPGPCRDPRPNASSNR